MSDPYQSVTVVNRRAIKWEGMFNGVCLVFQPFEKKSYPPNVAIALVSDSVLRTNLATGIQTTFALGIEGDPAYPTAPLEGSLARKNPIEQLDRKDVPRLTETEPKALGATGIESLNIGKNEKTVTPLPGAVPPDDTQAPTEESAEQGEGAAPSDGVPKASEEDVKPLSFVNTEVQRGPQRRGPAEHRISNKSVS